MLTKLKVLFFLFLFSNLTKAQQTIQLPHSNVSIGQGIISTEFFDHSFENDNATSYRGAIISNTYSVGGNYSILGTGAKLVLGDYLFPGNAKFKYANGYHNCLTRKIASVIDPKSEKFKKIDPDFGKNLVYNLSELTVFYKYRRHTSSKIKDTLILEIGSDSAVATLELLGALVTTNFGVKSINFKGLSFSATSDGAGRIKAPKTVVYTIVLDSASQADSSSNGLNGIKLNSTHLSALRRYGASENILIAMSFKPGYTYKASDTITKNKNHLQFLSWEEQGLNSFPVYNENDWNCSFIADSVSLTAPLSNPWYQKFNPTWIYNKSFAFEHHDFIAKTSYDYDWLSVADQTKTIAFGNCFPNPANNEIQISYFVKQQENILIQLYTIDGKLIKEQNEGTRFNGNHLATLNIESLPSGMYMYTINNGEKKKLIVN